MEDTQPIQPPTSSEDGGPSAPTLQTNSDDTTKSGVNEKSSAREFTCLDCNATFDSFLIECPDCQCTSFETGTVGDSAEGTAQNDISSERLVELNPYIPR